MKCRCRCGRIIDCGETECGVCGPTDKEVEDAREAEEGV